MRLLADECCPHPVVRALRQAGHDVRSVSETDRGSGDGDVAAWAEADDRVLLTEDYDFAELVIRQGIALPGLVILAFAGRPMSLRISRTTEVVGRLDAELRGHVTMIEPERERRRPIAGA